MVKDIRYFYLTLVMIAVSLESNYFLFSAKSNKKTMKNIELFSFSRNLNFEEKRVYVVMVM